MLLLYAHSSPGANIFLFQENSLCSFLIECGVLWGEEGEEGRNNGRPPRIIKIRGRCGRNLLGKGSTGGKEELEKEKKEEEEGM